MATRWPSWNAIALMRPATSGRSVTDSSERRLPTAVIVCGSGAVATLTASTVTRRRARPLRAARRPCAGARRAAGARAAPASRCCRTSSRRPAATSDDRAQRSRRRPLCSSESNTDRFGSRTSKGLIMRCSPDDPANAVATARDAARRRRDTSRLCAVALHAARIRGRRASHRVPLRDLPRRSASGRLPNDSSSSQTTTARLPFLLAIAGAALAARLPRDATPRRSPPRAYPNRPGQAGRAVSARRLARHHGPR